MRYALAGLLGIGLALSAFRVTASSPSIALDDPVPGGSFKSLVVSGRVDWQDAVATGTSTNICIVLADCDSTNATYTIAYDETLGGKFTYEIDDLPVGNVYDLSAYVEMATVVTNGSGKSRTVTTNRLNSARTGASVVTARPVDWFYEDAKTFQGKISGSGTWYGGDGSAEVDGSTIRLSASEWTGATYFDAANRSIAVGSSSVRELRFAASFQYPGYYANEEDVPAPEDPIAAITLMADAKGEYCFSVVSNGVWAVVPRSVYAPELDTMYTFLVRIDFGVGKVIYDLVRDDAGNCLTLLVSDLDARPEALLFEYAGSGGLKSAVGTCHDAHLFESGYVEYEDMASARAAAGEDRTITPLWFSAYGVTDDSGAFRLDDPNHYLDVTFAKRHRYTIAEENGVTVYRYLPSINWIDYADASGVESFEGGWLVTNEVGLAYLAERAANDWLAGDIVLGADLDLSSRNWTPIAFFTGAFDGKGHTITGLGNSHVVTERGMTLADPNGTTNGWGRTAYGLFGTSTNALFESVVLRNVSISNAADSVAALVGVHAGGDLEVAGVETASGSVRGTGRATAGLLTVGVNDELAVGSVVVTGNVNRATIGGTIANNADGGNVAQILAGAAWGTTFGAVVATNNVAAGKFDVKVLQHEGSSFTLPVCNFAAATVYSCSDALQPYRRFVEANEEDSVPIDPFKHTARMLAGTFANGFANEMGAWVDAITASPNGGKIVVEGSGATFDGWTTVEIDRDIAIDLNGNTINCIYDCDVFYVDAGVTLTISNGKIYYVEGYKAFGGSGGTSSSGISLEQVDGDFYARTTGQIGSLTMANGTVMIELPNASDSYLYILQYKKDLSDNTLWEPVTCNYLQGDEILTLEDSVPASSSGFYRVVVESW